MLHFLASAYFVLLGVGGIAVVAAMLILNRALILEALGLEQALVMQPLPVRIDRPRPQARVVRMASLTPAPALRLAA